MRNPVSVALRALPGLAAVSITLALALTGCGEDIKLERRTITYPNGKSVREDWTFFRKPNGDSLKHGVHKKFFWSGATSESVIWKQGQRDGSAQAWYDNGAVKWQKSYVDGKKHSTWRLSFKDGHPWMVMTYDKDVIIGEVQVWDKTGSPDPKTATFANGSCQSGACNLLEAPVIPADITAAEQVNLTRDWEIVKEFLD